MNTCKVCHIEKPDSLFVQIKGKRVGLVCRMCRNDQMAATRRNRESIAVAKAEKLLLVQSGLAICSKCGETKPDAEYPQQFGKRWGSVCSSCTGELKKKWFKASQYGQEIQARADKLADRRKATKERIAKRILDSAFSVSLEAETVCSICGIEKPNTDFAVVKGKRHGKRCLECASIATQVYCKRKFEESPSAFRARRTHEAGLRRAEMAKRMPLWSDKMAIKTIYMNRPEGYHVDHIIPLFGKNVSGLHIASNLQYLPAMENMKKNCKYDVMAQFK